MMIIGVICFCVDQMLAFVSSVIYHVKCVVKCG